MLNRYAGACFAAVSILLCGCSNEFSGDSYSSRNAGEVSRADQGTIISMRRVKIKPDSSDLGAGALLGGIGGGLVGSMFGKGSGKMLTTAAGAIAGGVGGNAIQNREQDGVEYVVKLDTGSTITLAQGPSPALSVGQKVHVVNSNKGRSRVVPA